MQSDRADWQAQRTARAFVGQDRMGQAACADDGVDWTGVQTQGAGDATRLIDSGEGRLGASGCGVGLRQMPELQSFQQLIAGTGSARHTTVRGSGSRRQGFRVRPAAGIVALAALSLGQQRVKRRRQIGLCGHRAARQPGKSHAQAREQSGQCQQCEPIHRLDLHQSVEAQKGQRDHAQ